MVARTSILKRAYEPLFLHAIQGHVHGAAFEFFIRKCNEFQTVEAPARCEER